MPIIIILVVGVVLFIGFSHYRFNQMVNAEIDALTPEQTTVSHADVEQLPEPVQKYLKQNIQAGQPHINTVRLKQSGVMRLAPDKPWKPFTAEQHFTVNPPAFIWKAKLPLLPFIWVSVRDKYVQQQGNMLIKVLSTLTIANATGSKIASSALIRFVAEMMWFPTSFTNADYLQWEAINANSARAIVDDKGVKAVVTFCFDDAGDITEVVADRYKEATDAHTTKWYGRVQQYAEFDGVRIPSEVEVGWELDTGYFGWWRGKIDEIQFKAATTR